MSIDFSKITPRDNPFIAARALRYYAKLEVARAMLPQFRRRQMPQDTDMEWLWEQFQNPRDSPLTEVEFLARHMNPAEWHDLDML